MNEIILKEKEHNITEYMKIIIGSVKLYLIILSVLMYDINFVLLHINILFTDDSIWRQIEYYYLLRMTPLSVI